LDDFLKFAAEFTNPETKLFKNQETLTEMKRASSFIPTMTREITTGSGHSIAELTSSATAEIHRVLHQLFSLILKQMSAMPL
jgi:hypothetical protein